MSSGPPGGHHLSMHAHIFLLAQTSATTAGKSTKSSSSFVPLLVIVAIFAVAYFVFIRPRQARLRQQQGATRTLAIGDEVMSAGGILGRVVALDSDEVEVEVSPGVVMTFVRRAINPRPASAGSIASAAAAEEEPDDPWATGGPDTDHNADHGDDEPTPPGEGGSPGPTGS